MKVNGVISLGLGLAFCLTTPVTEAADVGIRNGDRPVSSDGTRPAAVAEGYPLMGVSGFAGTAGRVELDDGDSEQAASVASKAEMDDLKKYKPIVPKYAEGRAASESVIGDDSRYRIYPKASGYPERAIGLITLSQGGGSYTCTGWLISADTVATAGHCVHSGGSDGVWSDDVKFYPGRDGSKTPFGYCTSTNLYSVDGWTVDGAENHDYGAIKLDCTVGNEVGWFGIFWDSDSLVGLPVQVSGYPGDKRAGTQWSASGAIEVSQKFKTRYRHDTYGGESGGPVFETDRTGLYCTGACANSIHTYGKYNGRNSATRITKAVYNNLVKWKDAP